MTTIFEKIHQHKKNLLKSVLQGFQAINLQPRIGIELEFYLQNQGKPADQETTLQFISHLQLAIRKQNINLLGIEPEQGLGQVEIKTLPYLDIEKLCEDILKIKEIAKDLNPDLPVNFASQPYLEDCGSALQINFSLLQNGQYLFAKNGEEESKYLLDSISSALKFSKNMMLVFAPLPEDYLRFDLELNRNLHKKQKFTAPVNISWGYNNRTALVRIPQTKKNEERRLEFRLGSSLADVYLACSIFLLAILEGVNQEKNILEDAIYGNAFNPQYKLEVLPTFIEAQNYFMSDNPLIRKILAYISQL